MSFYTANVFENEFLSSKMPFLHMHSENMAKIALNAVRLPKFEPVNGIS